MQGRSSIDPRWKAVHEDGSDFPGETHPAMIALETGKRVANVVMGVYSPRDEEYHWIRVDAMPYFEMGEDKPYRVSTTLIDITEFKRTEEKLERSEKRFRALIERSADAISLADADGTITYASPAAGRIVGVTPNQLIGHSTFDGIHPDDVSNLRALFTEVAETPGRTLLGEFRLRHKDGSWHWVEGSGTNLLGDPDVHAMVANFRDISERKRVTEEFRFQSNLLDMVEQAVIATDLEGKIIYWNHFAEKLYGWTAKEVLGQSALTVIPSDGTQAQAAEIMNRLGQGESWSGEFGVKKRDGTLFPAHVTDSPIYNTKRELIGVVGVSFDITERKLAEQALATSEARFRALIEKSAEAFALLGADGDIRYASPSISRILGYEESDGILNVFEVIHPDDVEAVVGLYIEIAAKPGASANITIRERHKDGSWRWMECTGTNLMDDPAVNAMVINFRDVTERKQAGAEIRQQAEEFAALYETAQELANQQDVTASLQIIAERAMSLLHTTTVAIHIYDPERDDLELLARNGPTRPVGSRLKLGDGIAGYVAKTREAVSTNDYDSWTNSTLPLEKGVLNAVAGVPMLHLGELIGVLVVAEDNSPRLFSDGDVQLLSLFASQAASAVYNARLLAQTRLRAEQLALLYDAGLTLNKELDPKEQLELLLKIGMKAVSADRAAYYRFEPEHNQLKIELCLGYSESLDKIMRSRVFKVDDAVALVSQVAQQRTPLNVPDVTVLPNWIVVDPDVRSGIWVPVEHEDELRGVIQVLSTRAHAFTPHDERLLVLFASQAAVALKNARLFEQISRHYDQIQALRTIDEAISSSLDLSISLHVVLEQVVSRMQVDAADVLVFNRKSHVLELSAGRGFRSATLRQAPVRLGESLMERKLFASLNLIRDPAELNRAPLMAGEGFVSYAAIPLVAKGQVKGVLEVFGRTPFRSDNEWSDYFRTLAGQTAIAIDHVQLFEDLQRSNLSLEMAYDSTIEGWSRALDLRDKETEGHTQRVAELTWQLARVMGLGDSELLHIRRGALLHDMGKMGVPDAILLKPGPLTEEEWAIMRTHPSKAYDLLAPIAYLKLALDIPYAHHEKWDGTGYPRGLKGDMIPMAARIFAVVDVWDALTSDRPYRAAWTKERASEYIVQEAGKHFDPQVVQNFVRYIQEQAMIMN